jgi:hypothetical protein
MKIKERNKPSTLSISFSNGCPFAVYFVFVNPNQKELERNNNVNEAPRSFSSSVAHRRKIRIFNTVFEINE